MTESEARSKIKYRIEVARQIAGNGVDGKSFEDLEIALQVMKEIREYRELGTVEELKALRNASELWEHNNNLAYKQGRIDAIDEFVKEIEAEYDNDGCPNVSDYLDYKISIRDLQKIAEQMKKED